MQPRPQPGHKRRRYKARGFLKGFHHWVGSSKLTRRQAAREDRHNARKDLRDQ